MVQTSSITIVSMVVLRHHTLPSAKKFNGFCPSYFLNGQVCGCSIAIKPLETVVVEWGRSAVVH